MKTADEILDEELSETMIEKISEIPLFREWIKDAMYAYAKEYHESEVKKLNLLDVSGQVCDFCLDTYRVQEHEVCERCRKLLGD